MSNVNWDAYAQELRHVAERRELGVHTVHALTQAAYLCEIRARQLGGMECDDAPTPVRGTPRVCIESPLRGDVMTNVLYADCCMFDALVHDEAPFLGHLLYPRVLDDAENYDRERGINAHLAWLRRCDRVALYIDLGVSSGMAEAARLAHELGLPVVERELGAGWRKMASFLRATKHFLVTEGKVT